ncbi:DUF6056 family protein [Pontibacter roseus]|uniref:DUF6056 family protein n=1 Tax=Pontibacter roseus TaxID=336989 RepID=UPI00037F034C|nr:DUF6056 family protein [Pontibacter roseus]
MLQERQQSPSLYIGVILITISVYTLLPFLLLTLFTHPTADDFSFAVRDTTLSFFESQVEFYLNWSGRYFGTAIVRINPLTTESLKVYKLYACLTLIVFCIQVYWLINLVIKGELSKLKAFTLTAILICLYLLLIPSTAEGFYFFTTYATYQFPNILMLLMLSLLYAFFQSENTAAKLSYIAMASISCIAIVGSNEMSLILAFTTLLLLLVTNLKNKEARPYLLLLFTICVASCLIAVLAPGNYARMNDHPNASRFWWSAVYSALLTLITFYRWSAPVLAVSVLYMLFIGIPLADKTRESRLFNVDLRLAAMYFLGTIFLMYFAFAWSTGERATPRVENVICFFFIFGWFYLLQLALHTYRHQLKYEHLLSPAIPTAALLLFALNILSVDSNVTTAYIDLLSGKAAAYDKALTSRYVSLKASDCKKCEVPPLPAIPKTIYFSDILEGSKNDDMWINSGFARYWGKEAVHLSAPNPPIKENITTLRESGKNTLRNESIIE